MIVVADTTPLNYLILIDEIGILPKIYRNILIPTEVHRELQSSRTPVKVRTWASELPSWCSVRSASVSSNATLQTLDAGEREAIQLALDAGIGTILMDESLGRRAALLHHLEVTGTIGLLEKAALLNLLDFRSTLARLEQTNFRLSESLRDDFLRRNP